METPKNIRVLKSDRILELTWNDTDVSRLPFRSVRQDCRCAACVDEFTGRQVLDRASVSESIMPDDVSLTGNYALKIRWSDGHESGLFTWDHLRAIANQLAADST
ncbi:MAG: DUF971 domain-containing protein [Planctomycetaceae bacterium]